MYDSYLILIIMLLVLVCGACVYVSVRYIRLKKSSDFEAMVVSALPLSMFLLDKHKIIRKIYNISSSAMAGYRKSDIIGKHISFFADDPDSPFYQACKLLNDSFDRVINTGENDYFQYMINDSYLEARIVLIPGGYVLSVVSDVSIATRKVNEMMRKKQNEISVALQAGGLFSWSYDVVTRTFDSNTSNRVIVGSMSYDLLMSMIDPQDRHLAKEGIGSILCKKVDQCEFTVRVVNGRGKISWENIHAVTDGYDENGNVIRIIGSQKNISQEVETINELIRLRKQAEDSNRLKSAFIANMSHEIRTPLNAIVGFSNLLASTNEKSEIEEYVKIIEQNNTLLLNIVNDVLYLSKIESGMTRTTVSKINIYDFVNNMGEIIRFKAKEGVEICVENIDRNMEVTTETDGLTQVFMNLLNNAVKFTDKGEIRLGCDYIDGGKMLKFYVKDTGRGIAQNEQKKIFERFVKVDSFVQGTGLGLSICESIVRHMGGDIGVESKCGEGSVFWFTVPVILEDKKKSAF